MQLNKLNMNGFKIYDISKLEFMNARWRFIIWLRILQ